MPNRVPIRLPGKRSKYGAVKTVVDGITFDSKKEANRYCVLKVLQKSKEISQLEVQPRYLLTVNGFKICEYRGDFGYVDSFGVRIVEDCKGVKTAVYRLKRKLMIACYGIHITET